MLNAILSASTSRAIRPKRAAEIVYGSTPLLRNGPRQLRADPSRKIKPLSLSAVSTSPIGLSVQQLSSCARLLTVCVLAYSSSSKPSAGYLVQLASQSLG